MLRFPDNSRVCFIGDSMTAANQVLWRVVDCYKRNLPDSNIRFFNCGTSGSKLEFALNHFDEDILPNKPTCAVIAYAINDAWIWELGKPHSAERYEKLKNAFETYKTDIKALCEKLKAIGVKDIIICTPPPYDEYQESETDVWKGGYALLTYYAAYIRQFAKENGYCCCDYNEFLIREIETDANAIISSDRVHPSVHGYFLMAKHFLSLQGFDIGEEIPMPEYITEWYTQVNKLREIFSVENNIIEVEAKGLSLDEKIEFVEKYLKEKNPTDYFLQISEMYLENKTKQSEIIKSISVIYDRDILNSTI